MTALDDALAQLRTAAAGQVDAAVALTAAATRHVADAQQVLALAARVAALAETAPPEADPGQAPNLVRIGAASYPLAAVNPTPTSNPAGAPFDGCRGEDQLILCRAPWSRSGTNRYGAEVAVEGGRLAGSITVGGVGGIAIPAADGYVLSGHGTAAAFLQQTFTAGAVVELLHVDQPPMHTPDPKPAGGKTLAVYLMDGVGHVGQIPPQCNRVLVAFYQGTSLVEWGGDSALQTAAALKSWQAGRAGNEVLISLGGQGGMVVLDQVDEGMAAINRTFPVAGIDFDAEAFSYTPEQAVAVARASAAAVGRAPRDFAVQLVPPGGSPVGPALAAAKALQVAGFMVTFGQQLYYTSISDQDVMTATQRAVDALGAGSVLVGVMLGDPYASWTLDSSESRMRQVVARWPGIAGAYLWESARSGTAEWARRVGAVLGL